MNNPQPITTGTGKAGNSAPVAPGNAGAAAPSGAAATGSVASGGTAGRPGPAPTGTATSGNSAAIGGAGSGARASDGSTAAAGVPATAGSDAPVAGELKPLYRNPKYTSLAPPVGAPLPAGTPGMWSWIDVEGALSRDGSPAGIYYRHSKTGNKNLLVYLAGGGVCADNFFCNMNPPNKAASLTAENVGSGVFNIFGPDQEPQDPSGERWQSGIFKDDPANPVKDWNMVFIPYVTGDVYFGSRPNGTVPDVEGTFQFVGKTNMLKFISRIVATYPDAGVVLLSGSSAGGIGSLLNYTYLADAYIDQGKGARVFVLDDAGPFFDDQHLEVCIQKRYRDIYGLNDSLPQECTGCFNADGGGLTAGLLKFLADKYPELVLGGIVDSDQDEIMKFFFSEGIENCAFIENPIVGLLAYPADRYPAALKHILNDLVDPSRLGAYVWTGDLHQNVFQTASADRFYLKNGLEKTVAEWLSSLLQGKGERIGAVK